MERKAIIVLLLAAVVLVALSGCNGENPGNGSDYQPNTEWREFKEKDFGEISVSDEWTNPTLFEEPINSDGWEDSAYISQDGKTLYFIYLNLDLLQLPKAVFVGPDRDPKGSCKGGAHCGQLPRADTFYSTKQSDGSWSVPLPFDLTLDEPIHGLVLANDNKAYFQIGEGGPNETQIAYSEKVNGVWGSHIEIPILNSPQREDDVYVTPDESIIMFWSTRPAKLGQKNIYFSKRVNGEWQAPIMLPEPINSDADDMHPFLFGGKTLYFSSGRGDGRLKIYKAELIGNDMADARSWSEPKVVISSNFAVGEPTLTADGKYLYFLIIFRSPKGEFTGDIAFVTRK